MAAMIISKVNGNEITDVKANVDYADVIKTLFILPIADQFYQEHPEVAETLEEVVDNIYEWFRHNQENFWNNSNEYFADVISNIYDMEYYEVE